MAYDKRYARPSKEPTDITVLDAYIYCYIFPQLPQFVRILTRSSTLDKTCTIVKIGLKIILVFDILAWFG